MNTSGFYKIDGDILLFASGCVLNKDYELRRETHEVHAYPVDGWQWFESEAEARIHFLLPPQEPSAP